MENLKIIKEQLRIAAAAYEAANNYDYCPEPDEAVTIPNDYHTEFTADEFRKAAEKYQGRSTSNMVDEIIFLIAKIP